MKHILFVKGNSLLSDGIEHLLDCEVDLSIQSISLENCTQLAGELISFHPEVIVMDERIYINNFCNLMKLLTAYPHLPFIVVSANDNILHIYTPRALSVTHASDFANAVRNI